MKTISLLSMLATLSLLPLRNAHAEKKRIACQVNALSKEEWQHLTLLVPRLTAAVAEKSELPDGYAFRFPGESAALVGEWIWYVARCCPMVDYQSEIGAKTGGALWVRLSGGEGVKEFITLEFAPLFAAVDAAARGK